MTFFPTPVMGPQSMFQPGFAGTDPQQVRSQIAREGGFGFAGAAPQPYAQGAIGMQPPALQGSVQAIYQPGFAGTDPQQVHSQIAREGGFGYAGVAPQPQPYPQGAATMQAPALHPPALQGSVQAIYQPGFAGTDPQQVRSQIAREGGFGYGAAPQPQPYPQGAATMQMQSPALQGSAQAIFQPGFAGTDPQQVRSQIAREGGFAYPQPIL